MLDRLIGMNGPPGKLYKRKKNRIRIRRGTDETICQLTREKRGNLVGDFPTSKEKPPPVVPLLVGREALGRILKNKSSVGCP